MFGGSDETLCQRRGSQPDHLFPERLDDWVDANNPVRVIDAFVDALDLRALGFDGIVSEATGRPSYRPAILLKLYIYGYLTRVPSSRRLEREAGRNVELMWLTGRLMPDHKTIATFRCWPLPISRSRSPIRMPARWPRAGAALGW